jgi:hypothetical protein
MANNASSIILLIFHQYAKFLKTPNAYISVHISLEVIEYVALILLMHYSDDFFVINNPILHFD